VKEELYLYLKKAEKKVPFLYQLQKANASSMQLKLIQFQFRPKIIYLSSILLGILIPSGIIYADDLLDTKLGVD
jgi:hypothetical protein